MTVSAIASFVRKAEQEGIKYHSFIHAVRPLMELYQTEYENKRMRDGLDGSDGGNEEKSSFLSAMDNNVEFKVESGENVDSMFVVEEDALEEDDLLAMQDALELQERCETDETVSGTRSSSGGDLNLDDGW